MRSVCSILLVAAGTALAQDGWFELNSGSSRALYSVYFVNAGTGWVAGDSGTVLSTIDGGETWTARSTGVSIALNAIRFANSRVGYAAGNSGTILKSADGGESWRVVYQGDSSENLLTLQVLDTLTAWAGGEGGALLKTEDGENWVSQNPVTVSDSSLSLNAVLSLYFTGSLMGYMVADGAVLKTEDGGTNWSSILAASEYEIFHSVRFVDEDTGFVVSDVVAGGPGGILEGWLRYTFDGGANWSEYRRPVSLSRVMESMMHATDAQSVYVISNTNVLKRGNDDWVVQVEIRSGLNSLYFPTDSVGYVVGNGGVILKTTTGGESLSAKPKLGPGFHREGSLLYFKLSAPGWVMVVLRDSRGRFAAQVGPEWRSGGNHVIDFSFPSLPAGIYRLEFQFGEIREILPWPVLR